MSCCRRPCLRRGWANIHVHTLALDGVYVRDERTRELGFHPLDEPTAEQVTAVAERTYERVKTILRRANRPLLRHEHGYTRAIGNHLVTTVARS